MDTSSAANTGVATGSGAPVMAGTAVLLPGKIGESRDTLHALANAVTGVLMNAQLVDWKLPPYSRLKQSVREIERNAQRAAKLIERLRNLLAPPTNASNQDWLCDGRLMAAVNTQEPGSPSRAGGARVGVEEPDSPSRAGGARSGEEIPAGDPATNLPPAANSPVPGFLSAAQPELTCHCDLCTSANFPKRDDKEGHQTP